MEKKIIAVVSIVILLVSVFAACGKVPTIKGDDGKEYLAVTDKEGNTKVNENGDVIVYETDVNGKYLKDENGERKTDAIPFPKVIVNGRKLETPDFVMSYPEGWEIDDAGIANMTDKEKMHIKIINYGKLETGESLDFYVSTMLQKTVEIVENLKKTCPDTELNQKSLEMTPQKLDCRILELKVTKEDGTVVLYNRDIYFMYEEELYKIEYSCKGGTYDSTVDIDSMIDSGLVMKEKGNK